MSILTDLLSDLYYSKVPRTILELGFRSYLLENPNVNLDEAITKLIIQNRLVKDVNRHAGKHTQIKLSHKWLKNIDLSSIAASNPLVGEYYVYQVPMSATGGRIITSAIEITYPNILGAGTMVPYTQQGTNSVTQNMNNLLDSYTGDGLIDFPIPYVKDGNIIALDRPFYNVGQEWLLSCMVGFDKNFSNLSPNVYPKLQKAFIELVKSYIYNELVVTKDEAGLVGGQKVEAITRIIEQYENADKDYEEGLVGLKGALSLDKDSLEMMLSAMTI